MKRSISFVSLIMILSSGFGQRLAPVLMLDKYPTFHAQEIKKWGFTSITIKEMVKPSTKPVMDKNVRFTYQFGKTGELIGYRKTFPTYGGKVDTVSTEFRYVDGKLAEKTEAIGRYRRKVEYEQIDGATTKRTINTKNRGFDWTVFEIEKMSLKQSANGSVMMIGGMNDVPYQKIISAWNKDSTKITKEVWNGSRMQSAEVTSIQNDLFAAYQHEDFLSETCLSIEFPKNYADDYGRWCKNDECRKFSIVTNSSGWPAAFIFIEESSENIEIWEIEYFY